MGQKEVPQGNLEGFLGNLPEDFDVNQEFFPSEDNGDRIGFLHLAVQRRDVDATILLVERYGANVNLLTVDRGVTPVHIAAERGCGRILAFLLERGGEIQTVSTKEGRTVLHYASQEGYHDIVHTVIHSLEQDALEELNREDYTGALPLHLAATTGNIELVSILHHTFPDSINQLCLGIQPLGIAEAKLRAMEEKNATQEDLAHQTAVIQFLEEKTER